MFKGFHFLTLFFQLLLDDTGENCYFHGNVLIIQERRDELQLWDDAATCSGGTFFLEFLEPMRVKKIREHGHRR